MPAIARKVNRRKRSLPDFALDLVTALDATRRGPIGSVCTIWSLKLKLPTPGCREFLVLTTEV